MSLSGRFWEGMAMDRMDRSTAKAHTTRLNLVLLSLAGVVFMNEDEDEDCCVCVMLVGRLWAIYTIVACCKTYSYWGYHVRLIESQPFLNDSIASPLIDIAGWLPSWRWSVFSVLQIPQRVPLSRKQCWAQYSNISYYHGISIKYKESYITIIRYALYLYSQYKRAKSRIANMPYCIVGGCSANLSLSKEVYHHNKTSIVQQP